MNLPSSRKAFTLCIVIKLEALGERRIIGSRFLPVVGVGEMMVGVPFKRVRKYCFAERETDVKSVGLVPRRMVRRDVIVRSLEWMRSTAALRLLMATDAFDGEALASSVTTEATVSSTVEVSQVQWGGHTDIIRGIASFKPSR
jgi:hypothetical protein